MNRRLASLLPVLTCLMLAGCRAPARTSAGGGLSPPARLFADPANPLAPPGRPGRKTPASPKAYVLALRLSLSAIEVPIGTVSGSEEIWSYLDEESIGQVRTGAIGLNGLRIGRGQAGSWPDIARILKTMAGRKVKIATMMGQPGRAIPITVKSNQKAQTIFIFRPDGTLHGQDYPPGDDLITLYCTLDEADPSKVLLTGMPQIRTARQKIRFVTSAGGMTMVNRPDYYSLTDLTFRTVMPSGDFLVIGPSEYSYRPTSVGHCFLVRDRKGMQFETLIVIKIETVAALASPAPAESMP